MKNGFGFVLLKRTDLVSRIISMATGEDKHVLVRGAAGSGKTSILALVGIHLKSKQQRVLMTSSPKYLPNLHTLLRMGDEDIEKPLYLIVDEAQQSYESGVLRELLKISVDVRNIIVIAAGIPGSEAQSAAFTNRLNPSELLLSIAELTKDDIIQAFQNKLEESLAPDTKSAEEMRSATVAVLQFAHTYTAGQAYPCLKIAEYCVTHHAERCFSPKPEVELGLIIGSKAFLDTAGTDIFSRCFPLYSSAGCVNDLKRIYSTKGPELSLNLLEQGLWDEENNRLLSPLLQYHIFHLVTPKDDFVFDNASKIGDALLICTRTLLPSQFSQYDAYSDYDRHRCEDGVGFFIGCELSKYCLVSPQHAIKISKPTRGRLPSVDYYLNGHVNMYLELVKNGSLLKEHFERFISGSYGLEKPFAILDINFEATKPLKLTGKYKKFEANFFTFVIKTRTLYKGSTPLSASAGDSLTALSLDSR